MYRDSAGRTRSDTITVLTPAVRNAVPPAPIILIGDPVAGYSYRVNERAKVAIRSPFGFTRAVRPAPEPGQPMDLPQATHANGPKTNIEDLGSQVIEGVQVTGRRTTTIYPIDFFGNDREISTATETWTCPDLRLVVVQKRSDPRNGDSVTKVENISRVEPDPALFVAPPGYTIHDSGAK
jgi:hypothetical protein